MISFGRRSLRSRILAHTSAAFVVVICTALFMVNAMMRHEVNSASKVASARAESFISWAVNGEIQELSKEGTLISQISYVRDLVNTNDTATISDYLNSQRDRTSADWLVITDPDGHIQGFSDAQTFKKGGSLSELATVSSALDGHAHAAIEIVNGRPAIIASNPIKPGGFVRGTLVSGKWLSAAFVQGVGNSFGVEVGFAYHGKIFASSTEGMTGLNAPSNVGEVKFAGVDYLDSNFRFPNDLAPQSLKGLAFVPAKLVKEPYAILSRGLIVLLCSSLIVLVVSSSAIAVSLTGPLQRLALAAKEMQEGRVPELQTSSREDEIGQLQASFDEMARSVRESKERLLAMLHVDPLTELQNHRSFRESLASIVQQAAACEAPIALILLDLDGFEKFNQASGPDVADEVLISVSRIVSRHIQQPHHCGRYGGNEFALVVEADQGEFIAELIRREIHAETPVTASIGVALLAEQTRRTDLLIIAAEIAVSQAKQAGRNRVRQFVSFNFNGDEEELQRFVLQSSYSAVKALAEAVDAKDEYTRGHSHRVASYAKALSQSMDYDSGFVDLVFTTGTLHDVGKIGVPDVVLKKTGRLTADEFDLIKRHAELGEKIVGQIPQLRDTLPGIRHHHERWDGQGYPDNLSGENIPLVARLLAVADAFDAMTSDRSYRKGMADEVAFEQIIKGAGSQFDPDLAIQFVRVMREQRQKAA